MSEKTLAIPELVTTVLRHLDLTSLVAAAQVNRMWAHEATNFIWRGAYRQNPYEEMAVVLRKMEDYSEERRNWYTNKIRHLHLAFEPNFKEDKMIPIVPLLKQKGFQFPYIRSLVVEALDEDGEEIAVSGFLQPSLLCLEIFSACYTQSLFEQIRANAPFLRVLKLDEGTFTQSFKTPEELLDATAFLRFLQAMPSIEVLELLAEQRLFDIEVMRHIFTRPGLQALHISPFVLDMELLDEINPPGGILQNLRSLQLAGHEKPLSLILSRMSHIQAVDLILICTPFQGPGFTSFTTFLESLSRCPELEEISITFNNDDVGTVLDKTMSNSALLSLVTNCPFIRALRINTTLQASMTDDLIETMASRLVHLEAFSLKTPRFRGLSYKAIASFARHCPSLHELYLPIRVELPKLEDEPDDVRFPKLQLLHVARATFLPAEMAEDCNSLHETLIRLLDSRFPRLIIFGNLPGFSSHARQMQVSIANYLRKRFSRSSPRVKLVWKAIKQSILKD